MENKEPKIFKTLVHKETGEYIGCGTLGGLDQVEIPHIRDIDVVIEDIEYKYDVDLTGCELKEVVVLTKEEYEMLKEKSEELSKLKEASLKGIDGFAQLAKSINETKKDNQEWKHDGMGY